MSQENCSKGKHITQEERIIIANRHQNGEDYKAIASAIHRPSCTVWRELHRNGALPDVQTTRVNKPRTDARHCKNSEEAEVIKANKRRYEKRLKTFLVHSKLRYNANVAAKKAAVRTKRQTPMLERTRNEELLSFIITTLDSGWTPEQMCGIMQLKENHYENFM